MIYHGMIIAYKQQVDVEVINKPMLFFVDAIVVARVRLPIS